MGVQRVMLGGQRIWTVVAEDHLPVGPAEEYLEFLRVAQQSSPNGPFLCHLAGPLVGIPDCGWDGLGRGELAVLRLVRGVAADRGPCRGEAASRRGSARRASEVDAG